MSKYPLRSSKKELSRALKYGQRFIKNHLSKSDYHLIDVIQTKAKLGDDTRRQYSHNGKYTKSRAAIHNKIIRKIIRGGKRTGSSDLYVLGGVPASGKTTALKKYIHEKCIVIDNDYIKRLLTKYSKSPSRKYGMIHASLLHEEASDIEKKLVMAALKTKKDIILDRTLANYNKNLSLIKKFIRGKYRITTLGTQLRPHIAILRAARRFIKDGRYVPSGYIAAKGNQINRNVMRMARNRFNYRSKVVDTTSRRHKVVYSKGRW